MPVQTVQYRFTSGEFDPKLRGRADTEQYYAGADEMTNVFTIPQGGFRRRPGLEYLDRLHRQVTNSSGTYTAPNGGTAANANDLNTATVLTTVTGISTTDDYVVVSVDLGSLQDVAFIDLVGATISAGTSDEFDVEVSDDGASWTVLEGIDLSTTAITKRVRVRDNIRYARYIRNGTTDLGSEVVELQEFNVWIESSTLSATRLVPFSFNNEQNYMLALTDKNISVYKDGVFQVDVRATDFTSSTLQFINYTQSADTAIFVHEDIYPKRLTRTGDTAWTFADAPLVSIPKYDFVPVTTNPAATLTPSAVSGTVTLTAGSSVFTASDVGQYVDGGGGRARIVSYTSGTVVTAVTVIPFYSTSAIASGDWELQSGYEDVWSTTRGYPKSTTFHDGRLWFGGSKSRPQTLWASRVNEFFNFDVGASNDAEAIDVTIDTDQVNEIVNVVSQRTLQIFTTGGEFAIIQQLNDPITPSNINIRRQTQRGSKRGLRVYEENGLSLFVQRGGRSVLGFIYSELQQSYENQEISLLASHLVDDPVDMSLRKATSTDESTLLLMVNTSGTLSVATLLLQQNILAFCEQETTGTFKNTAVDIDDMYFIVERDLADGAQNYIERFNENHLTDASVRFTSGLPTDTFSSGIDHLEGETVKVRADDSVLGDETVTSGSVTIDRDAEEYCEVGLGYTPVVTTLPVEIPKYGSLLGRKKRISEVVLRLYETSGIIVNGNTVSFRGFGLAGAGSPLDAAPPQFTGDKRIEGIKGWTDLGQVTITQESPTPMTVLAVSMRVGI